MQDYGMPLPHESGLWRPVRSTLVSSGQVTWIEFINSFNKLNPQTLYLPHPPQTKLGTCHQLPYTLYLPYICLVITFQCCFIAYLLYYQDQHGKEHVHLAHTVSLVPNTVLDIRYAMTILLRLYACVKQGDGTDWNIIKLEFKVGGQTI